MKFDINGVLLEICPVRESIKRFFVDELGHFKSDRNDHTDIKIVFKEKIRENEKWNDIPVFAVTAKAMKDDKDVILNHGFADYIAKPVNPTIVSFKIEKLLGELKAS